MVRSSAQRFICFHPTIALLCALVSACAQTHPMEKFQAIGPYLNHSMPEALAEPGWSAVPAFPHLLFTNAVGLAPVPGTSNLLCVWEREGRVWTFTNSPETSSKKLLLDLSAQCQGWDDSGLLGLAFHPGFPTNHFLFVYYAWVRQGTVQGSPTRRPSASTPTRLRLSRFTVNPGYVAAAGSELVFIDQKAPSIWHMGGALLFHAMDGCLYLGIGDNDERTNTQCLDRDLFSGILRIDVDRRGGDFSHPVPRQPEHGTIANYFIPNNNPFVGRSNVLEEFFALGLRNPYRMSCDPDTGRLFITDVGEQLREEINLVEPTESLGLNFQWPLIEGLQGNLTPPYLGVNKRPWLDYTHVEGQAVIGGFVYRGHAFRAELGGKYIFGDNVQGKVWCADPSTPSPTKRLLCMVTNGPGPSPGPNYVGLSSFGQDQNDELYICQMSSFGGLIFKLAPNPQAKPIQPLPSLISQTGAFSDLKAGRPMQAFIPYDVNSPLWSDGAVKERWMAVPRSSKIEFSPKEAWRLPNGSVFIKTFSLPIDEAHPSKVKRLETRFLVRDTNGTAYGVTYKWRPDNSDADLLTNSLTETVAIAQRPLGLFRVVDIGNPARKGSFRELVANREERVYEVKSFDHGGNDLTDELAFAWQERRGDFDIQVRIDAFAAAPDGEAGLAVRESLAPGSRQVSALVFPDNNLRADNHGGYQLQYRAVPGGRTSVLAPPDPQPTVAYPQAWLRLKRRGNEFSGFASQDGITWRSFGSASLPLPESIKFGMALSARSDRVGGAARFRFPALRRQPWYYPSSEDCLSCHTRAAQYVLGVNTRQLNRDFVYPDAPVAENELRRWNQLKLFEPPLQENTVTQLDRLAPIADTSAPLELRVRSYLDSNCSQCHRPGGAPVMWDARFDAPPSSQGIINGSVYHSMGIPDAKVVVPHDPFRSILYRRIANGEADKMPPLAKNLVDDYAAAAVAAWIRDLQAE